jgi:hypothetical protein
VGAPSRWAGTGATPSRSAPQPLALPAWATALQPGANADPAAPQLLLSASSPLQPPVQLAACLRTGGVAPVRPLRTGEAAGPALERAAAEALDSVPPEARAVLQRCTLLRLTVPSPGAAVAGCAEGAGSSAAGGPARVPVTLLLPPGAAQQLPWWRAGARAQWEDEAGVTWQLLRPPAADPQPHAPAPRALLAAVYGAYGVALEAGWEAGAAALAGRGVAVARLHVRGGKGPGWVQGVRAVKGRGPGGFRGLGL